MNWQEKITETITKTTPYAFGIKIIDPEEMDNVCRYVVQIVEAVMRNLAHHMHTEGVKDGMMKAGIEDPQYEADAHKFFSDRLFEKWSEEYDTGER